MLFESANPFSAPRPADRSAMRAPFATGAGEEASDPAGERALLKKRARALAQPLAAPLPMQGLPEFVVLRIADERYLVEATSVRDSVAARDFTPVPGAPPFIAGITLVRGRIVAIADFRRLLGLPARSAGEAGKLVVLEHRGIEFALAVEELTLPAGGAVTKPSALSPAGGPDPKFIRGVTPDGLILLDLAAISSALVVNEEH